MRVLGTKDLRPQIETDGLTICCPVLGCTERVPIQKERFVATKEFLCPLHRIYIGRTTFEYEDAHDNLLSTLPAVLERLAQASQCKRESRMQRERSEDALTWNVFSHLEGSGQLGEWVRSVTGAAADDAKIHYWACDGGSGKPWGPLAAARAAFTEAAKKESEPDLIITTRDAFVWVEAKLGSPNNTRPSEVDGARSRYTSGGSRWYESVVRSDFDTVAVTLRRYELLRLWLLGTWAAAQYGKRFQLVNLVRQGYEKDGPAFAEVHFNTTPARRFHRATWESIHDLVAAASNPTDSDLRLTDYLRTKSLGYSSSGKLLRAFALA